MVIKRKSCNSQCAIKDIKYHSKDKLLYPGIYGIVFYGTFLLDASIIVSLPLQNGYFKSVSFLHFSLLICCLVFLYWSLKLTVSFLQKKHNIFSKLLQILKDIVVIIVLFLLLLSGDIHPNPGPSTFNFMHYNVNSLKAHNFTRVR